MLRPHTFRPCQTDSDNRYNPWFRCTTQPRHPRGQRGVSRCARADRHLVPKDPAVKQQILAGAFAARASSHLFIRSIPCPITAAIAISCVTYLPNWWLYHVTKIITRLAKLPRQTSSTTRANCSATKPRKALGSEVYENIPLLSVSTVRLRRRFLRRVRDPLLWRVCYCRSWRAVRMFCASLRPADCLIPSEHSADDLLLLEMQPNHSSK